MESYQILIALLGSITSVITSVVAGYYAVRVARIERKRTGKKVSEDKQEKDENLVSAYFSLSTIILFLLSIPVFFAIAFLGNWLSGTAIDYLFIDSLDVALVCPVFFFISYLISTKLFFEKADIRRIIIPTIIIGLLIMPFIYLVALTLNVAISPDFVDFRILPDEQNPTIGYLNFNMGAAFDAMVIGGLAIISGFLIGASKKKVTLSLH
ncbi:MAG: hypothetical protein B6D38_02835 [Anaerolineae bacterium UTCFX1]|jgi:heme/copper-type cytochrome/quinol oxidase subunit 2|nr:MAG: hypothetical protein B6D38_02835 [Anaerolineae bacterium UTCFX1]